MLGLRDCASTRLVTASHPSHASPSSPCHQAMSQAGITNTSQRTFRLAPRAMRDVVGIARLEVATPSAQPL